MAMAVQAHPRGASFSRRRLHRFVNGESPIPALGFFLWVAGASAVQLAHGAPNPADPGVVTILGAAGALLGAAFHLARKRTVEGIQLTAFLFWCVAAAIGFAIYIPHVIALSF